ncbi:MAG TPA: UDP-glucose 4-epimerase GalE [Verrucomicrobiae bacterium]|nr:UDP-glucose 4-epimerase GalE [Verrucomicrobiae bacterium]
MENFSDLENLLKQNDGRYLVFEGGKPKMVILEPEKYNKIMGRQNNESNKILVTGGAGYIGSHAVADLLDDGYEVIVLDNLSTGYITSAPTPLIIGDLLDSKLLDKIFEQYNISAVVHFAGSIIVEESILNPQKYFDNNLNGSINLVNAMIRHGVKKIVYSSSAAVYGSPRYVPIDEDHPCQPLNPYGDSKLMFERVLNWYMQAHDLSSVIFRYFNAAGGSPELGLGESHPVETHLIPRILAVANKEEELVRIYGYDYPTIDGTAVRDYIHVKDLARAHTLALEKLSQDSGTFIYNVGTGKGYSVAQIIDTVIEVTGKMVPIERSERRPGDPPILIADNKKIKRELKFEPRHSDLETIISTAWEWQKKKTVSKSMLREAKNS